MYDNGQNCNKYMHLACYLLRKMYASPPHLDMSTSGITNLFSTNVGAFQYLTESALVPCYPKDKFYDWRTKKMNINYPN